MDDSLYIRPWQIYALAALSVAGGVAGVMIFAGNVSGEAALLIGALLPFAGALVTGAR